MASHLKTPLYKFAPASELGPAEDFPPGSIEWAERISNRLQISAGSVSQHTVHHLANTIAAIWEVEPHPWEVWPDKQPFGTPDDYCFAVTGHSWEFLVNVVAEFSGVPEITAELMRTMLAKAQAEHRIQGAHQPADGRKRLGEQGSNNRERLLRRLARDHPDVLQRYKDGEFKSVRAAAMAAGIIKPTKPLDQLCTIACKLSPPERLAALEYLIHLIRLDAGPEAALSKINCLVHDMLHGNPPTPTLAKVLKP